MVGLGGRQAKARYVKSEYGATSWLSHGSMWVAMEPKRPPIVELPQEPSLQVGKDDELSDLSGERCAAGERSVGGTNAAGAD